MRKVFALLFSIFIFSFNCLYSQTSLSLKEIDKLIADGDSRDYQKALLELNKYFAENPEQFDLVQKRIDKIMNSRMLYTDYANELLRIIKSGEEGHNQELKDLTDKLLVLERNPGDSRLDVIKDMNYLMNMYQYSAVQNKTGELVAQKKWTQAAQKALEGFVPLRENFQVKYKGTNLIQNIFKHQENVLRLVEKQNLLISEIDTNIKNYESAVKENNSESANNYYGILKKNFETFSSTRNELLKEALYFNKESDSPERINSQKGAVSSTGNEEQDLYLKHADEYFYLCADCILGWRSNYTETHGLLGVYDTHYYSSLDYLRRITSDRIKINSDEFRNSSSIANFRSQGTLPDNENLKKNMDFCSCALGFNSFYDFLDTTELRSKRKYPNFGISIQYAYNLSKNTIGLVDSVVQISDLCKKGLGVDLPENALSQADKANRSIQEIFGYGSSIKKVTGGVNTNLNRSKTWGLEYLQLKKDAPKDPVLEWGSLEKTLDEYVAAIDDYSNESVSKLYQKIARWYAQNGQNFVLNAQNQSKEIELLTSGLENPQGRKYPELALEKGSVLNNYIADSKKVLADSQKKLESPYSADYKAETDSIALSIKQLDSLKTELNSSLTVAKKLAKEALNNKKKADEYLAEARKALKAQNFDKAAEYSNKANDLYNLSLGSNYSEEFSKTASEAVLTVLTDITEQRKMIISDEVDNLIMQANREYSNNNYSKAQNLLIQAQERWNVVFNDIQNQEIASLNEVVKISLSMNTGREVLPGDPLYKEVSNILNIANQYYDKGKALLKKGKKEEAEKCFNDSLLKLEELRAIVPFNKDANLLRLKNQQILEPEEFEKRFAERVESAKAEYKQKEKQLQAYNDLSDLALINPNYPGLAKLIEEIEYEIGKKKRPVQVSADKQQSVTLTAQARRLYNNAGSDQQKLKQALEIVGQALVKDSSNADARKLQSQIRSRIKVKPKVSSFELNEKYNEALEKFNSGDYYGANEIIKSLWSDSDNRTEKLERLKKRVEARL